MLRLILRLRPSAGRARPCALVAGPAALGCRSVPGTSCLRRFHNGTGSRTVSLGSILSHRRAFLRYPQLTATCRFYSLPPHQKVAYRTGFLGRLCIKVAAMSLRGVITKSRNVHRICRSSPRLKSVFALMEKVLNTVWL